MNKYKLDTTIDFPLYPWQKAFMGINIKQFGQFKEVLAFPVQINDELQKTARSFAYTYTLLFRKSDWERQKSIAGKRFIKEFDNTEFSILVDLEAELSHDAKMQTLFDKTFLLLENLKCADEIYHWGKTTHTYLKFADREKWLLSFPIKAWRNLMVIWSISEYRQRENKLEDLNSLLQMINSQSNSILVDKTKFEHLALSDNNKAELIKICIINEAEKLKNIAIINEITQSANVWENYVLRANALSPWLENEVRYRLNNRLINSVRQILTDDEMSILEDWGIKHRKTFSDLTLPITRF